MSDLMMAVNEIRDHADDYHLAEQYYEGSVGEVFCSPVVRRALRGALGGFDINLARRPVDAVLDRIKILAVTVPGSDTLTRQLIDLVWTPNRMDRYSKLVHWGALTYGDAYLIVWPGDLEGSVDVFYNSPVTTRVFYRPDNPRVKAFAAKLWEEGYGDQGYCRLNLYYPDRIEKWTTKPGSEGKEEVEWAPYQEEGEAWPIPNPYDEVPVFHFRTAEPYGHPEHRDAFGPQNAITKLSSTLMSTVDFQGFPQRYALTTVSDASKLIAWDDDATLAPDADDTDLEAGPGKVWQLPDTTKVGQFDPANVQAFLDPLRFYARAMSTATATPLRFFEPSGDVPSGESLRADDAPLAHRITDREAFFAEEWSETLTFAAFTTGVVLPQVDIQWAPVQTVDDQEGWQTALLKIQAGVPVRQVLTECGYLSDLVEGWLAGSDKANLDSRVDVLIKIGQAMQLLGSSVQLGSLDKSQVDTIIAQVIGEVIRDEQPGAA